MRHIEDREKRGQVVADAWRRFGVVQLGSLAVMAATWYAGRSRLSGVAVGGGGAQELVLAKDVLVGACVVSAVGSAIAGNMMTAQRRNGAVPMNDDGEVAADAPSKARRLGRLTDAFGLVNLCAGFGVVAVTAMLAMRAGKSGTWKAVSRFLP